MGLVESVPARRTLAPETLHSAFVSKRTIRHQLREVRAECSNSPRPDRCGGRSKVRSQTATEDPKAGNISPKSLRYAIAVASGEAIPESV
jgi:hypothetical protein